MSYERTLLDSCDGFCAGGHGLATAPVGLWRRLFRAAAVCNLGHGADGRGVPPCGGCHRLGTERVSRREQLAGAIQGTMGSQQNIRELDTGTIQLAMSNSAITYYAVRGEAGWDKPYDLRTVVTLAPNVGLFITKQDSGFRRSPT
jgi:hypothetical protein